MGPLDEFSAFAVARMRGRQGIPPGQNVLDRSYVPSKIITKSTAIRALVAAARNRGFKHP
jgi:hypothetical protein